MVEYIVSMSARYPNPNLEQDLGGDGVLTLTLTLTLTDLGGDGVLDGDEQPLLDRVRVTVRVRARVRVTSSTCLLTHLP